jgi:hypothetical protein
LVFKDAHGMTKVVAKYNTGERTSPTEACGEEPKPVVGVRSVLACY